MSGTLRFESRLVDLGREYLERGRTEDSIRVLNRVLSLRSLPPELLAEANFLLAQAKLAVHNTGEAAESLRQALESDPDNAECHFLLASALDDTEESGEALSHFARAAQLDPGDGRKIARYGRALARIKDRGRGVRLLQTAYASHDSDPEVVEEVVEGLIENDRFDEAELVVARSSYRHGDSRRFQKLANRVRVRSLESRLYGRPLGSDGASEILLFRHPARNSLGKPGGAKRPKREAVPPPASLPKAAAPRRVTSTKPVAVDENMTLVEILRRSGAASVGGIYENLGLIGKEQSPDQIRDITSALSDADTLASIVRGLPAASRKLLKTVVQLGGYVPASTVFQTDGEDSPPPDFVQPLLAHGLLYFGRSTKKRRGDQPLVIAAPVDLVGRLARVLRVKVGG